MPRAFARVSSSSRCGSESATIPAPTASSEFDHWAAETVGAGDIDSLKRMLEIAPAGHEAHPRTEHWAPLYIAMGAADASGATQRDVAVDGFWFGLSKRSWQFS